jgi:hypothetical protein
MVEFTALTWFRGFKGFRGFRRFKGSRVQGFKGSRFGFHTFNGSAAFAIRYKA